MTPTAPVGVREPAEQLDEDVGDRLGRGGLRRLDPHPVGGEVAGLEVDRRPLDARAAEVDAEGKGIHPPNLPHRPPTTEATGRRHTEVVPDGARGRNTMKTRMTRVPAAVLLRRGRAGRRSLRHAGAAWPVRPRRRRADSRSAARPPVRRQGTPRGRRRQPLLTVRLTNVGDHACTAGARPKRVSATSGRARDAKGALSPGAAPSPSTRRNGSTVVHWTDPGPVPAAECDEATATLVTLRVPSLEHTWRLPLKAQVCTTPDYAPDSMPRAPTECGRAGRLLGARLTDAANGVGGGGSTTAGRRTPRSMN